MNLNKFVRAALKTGLYLLEQADKATAEMREQVRDKVEDLTDRAPQNIFGQEDHTVRNVLVLAAGVGLGIAVGILFAPVSGEEIRSSIAGKVQDAGARVRERFSPERFSPERAPTGTEGM